MIFLLELTNVHSNSSLCTNLMKRRVIFVHEKLQSHGGQQKHHHKSLDKSNNTQVTTDFKSWNFRPAVHERHHPGLRVVRTSFFVPFYFSLSAEADSRFEFGGVGIQSLWYYHYTNCMILCK